MKPLIIYWIIGCIITGTSIGGRMNDCPKGDIKELTLITGIAVWPALLTAALFLKKTDTSCHSPPAGTEG